MGLSINGLKKGCWEDMDQMKGIKNGLTLDVALKWWQKLFVLHGTAVKCLEDQVQAGQSNQFHTYF